MVDRPKVGEAEAVISFTTKLPAQYHVPNDEMVLPSSLARYGLSEVVNHLLELDPPVPFDFLVNGEFLRATIGQFLSVQKLGTEKTLVVEYVLALSEPEPSEVDQVPDWISSLVALPGSWFAATSYDGTVRLYDQGAPKFQSRLSDKPLIGAAVACGGVNSSKMCVAGKDGSVRCLSVRHSNKSGAATGSVSVLRAPNATKAVESVALNEDVSLLASGGWDQEINVWRVGEDVFGPVDEGSPKLGPKRKASGGVTEGMRPKFSLKGHSQVVSCLQFGGRAQYPFTLFSGSWDCTMRVWDIAAASCICNWSIGRAATSLSVSPHGSPQVVTSHEDGHVSLWDVRATPHPSKEGALLLDATSGLPLASAQASHRRQASQATWCPQDMYRIASVGHDGVLCVLDPRSPKMPVQSVRIGKQGHNPNRLLCVAWLGREELVVGGSDGKVVRVNLGSHKTGEN